jgi:hypothetical protein
MLDRLAEQRNSSLVDIYCLRAEDWLVSSLSEVVLLTVVNLRSLNRQGTKGPMNVEALFQRGPVTDLLHFRKTTFRMI